MGVRVVKGIAALGLLGLSLTTAAAATLRLVPTFENCSVYVEGSQEPAAALRVMYRAKGTESWTPGHALYANAGMPVPRGSLVGLSPATDYDVRCLKDEVVLAEGAFRTWTDAVPIVRTVTLTDGEPLLIEESGSPDGWIRYTADPGLVIDGGYDDEEAILIENASYVIVDGLTVRGGKRHGFQVKNSHHIRIRNCDIAGFGRKGSVVKGGKYYEPGGKKPNNWDAGVYIDLAEQVVLEHCYMHDPRGTANSWAHGHPLGPNGIFVRAGPKGGLVVRYNDIIGSAEHRWNDAVEAYGNGKPHGGFRCDADVYGNYLAFANDDGIELEGGQQNIRFYGNKVEGALCGISTAPNIIGPSYVFGNLVVNLGEDRGNASAAVKNGGGSTYSKGLTHFYNNTFFTRGRGIAGVGFGRDKNKQMFRAVSRNNILALSAAGINDAHAPPQCDYDYDLFADPFGGKGACDVAREVEPNAVYAAPGFVNALAGDFRLAADSAARGAGVVVPGLHDADAAVDMGALPANGPYAFLPYRPTKLTADACQVRLTGVRGDDTGMEASVTLDGAGLQTAQPFRIVKNNAFKWLKVTPESGTVEPGAKVALTVALDAELAPDGQSPGAFLVRLASGVSLPIAVHGTVLQCRYRQFFRAVDCEGAETFERKTVDGVECLDFSGHREEGITVRATVPKAGKYYLYYRAKCPEPYPMHDSIFVSVNGSELERCAVTASGNWHWDQKIGKVAWIELNEGENVIKLCQREGIYLESALVSSMPLFAGENVR